MAYGLELREVLRAVIAHHKADGWPEVALATKPRERGAQILEVMRPFVARYSPILTALEAWHRSLFALRRFVGDPIHDGMAAQIAGVIRALNRPIAVLSTLPVAPASIDLDDLEDLRSALDVVTKAAEMLYARIFPEGEDPNRLQDDVDAELDKVIREVDPDAADQAAQERRKRGRRATILTSPLGAVQSASNVRKTVLGAQNAPPDGSGKPP